MTAPSIKEALEKIATLEVTGGAAANLAEAALATLQPDGERREAIARIAYEGRHKGVCNCLEWDDPELQSQFLYYNIADAILASGLVQDDAGWQPIDTAPKDGQTWILIADDHCWPPDLVRWESERPARRTIDGYSKQKIPAGWFMSPGGRSRFDVPDGHLMKATRWMPLPAIRSARDGGEG